MSKTHRVKITLKPEALQEATAMRIARGISIPENFEGPEFLNVHEVSVEDGFLNVSLGDTLYGYPVTSIARYAFYK